MRSVEADPPERICLFEHKSFAPSGSLFCDGQAAPVASLPAALSPDSPVPSAHAVRATSLNTNRSPLRAHSFVTVRRRLSLRSERRYRLTRRFHLRTRSESARTSARNRVVLNRVREDSDELDVFGLKATLGLFRGE